ncbi:MAG: ABC transporter permease [Gammaproteobacteria bacterium]|nr:ABC transporter permease [Gammaproteobacteria bacterium]
MSVTTAIITPAGLALGFIPVAVVIVILYRWSSDTRGAVYAVFRMLIQLLLIGYVLVYIFETDSPWLIMLVLAAMLFISSWISMRPIQHRQAGLYIRVLLAIAIGGVPTLILVTQFVIDVEPWYQPSYLVPLAGMIFAGAMNAVSLAAERFEAERDGGKAYPDARRIALQAALIPLINSLLAVGLVALPGMMTGQILAGVSPLIAARYQIVVMCMLFGSSGIAAACYLAAARRTSESDASSATKEN